MASQVGTWIVDKLLSLGKDRDTEYDGEYCQILKVNASVPANILVLTYTIKWCDKRDPLDVDAVFIAEISDRDVRIPLKIPHEVACDVEK
jgi:hypothetical protein